MAQLTTLPAGIEVFRPGRHIDDAGGVHEFSPADIAASAAAYDPALREAPLTVGHPTDNRPAYGWVKRMAVNAAGRLTMDTHQVQPEFAEWVDRKLFKKRSTSFYPPAHPNNPRPGVWYPRHVAFLGAQPPAVAGLADFSDAEEGVVNFSEADPDLSEAGQSTKEHSMSDQEKAALARAEQAEADAKAAADRAATAEAKAKAAADQLAQFAEQQRQARHASHVAFCEGLAAAEGEHAGKLLPKDVQVAATALDLLADAQPVEFAEGDTVRKVSPVEWLKQHMAGRAPVVQFGEFAPGNAGTDPRSVENLSDAEVDKRAKAYAHKHNVSYAEALGAVVSFTVV